MRRPLTLRQIDVFRAMIEVGTVSKASAVLGMSQPAASKLLAYLEEDSGLRLFDRVKGRLVPTAVGLRLYEEVEKVFSGVNQIERAIDALHRQELERLIIGVIPILEGVAALAVSRFMERNTQVALSVEVRGSPHLTEAISSRRVDIGIFGGQIDIPHLQSQTILRRRLVCIVPVKHPLAGRSAVTLQDMGDYPFIRHAALTRTQQLVNEMCEQVGFFPTSRLEINTARMMCDCILAGMGVGIAHPVALTGFEGRLVAVPLEPALTTDYQVGWLSQNRNSKLIKAFIEEITTVSKGWP